LGGSAIALTTNGTGTVAYGSYIQSITASTSFTMIQKLFCDIILIADSRPTVIDKARYFFLIIYMMFLSSISMADIGLEDLLKRAFNSSENALKGTISGTFSGNQRLEGCLLVYDTGLTDYGSICHDGTDLEFTSANTTLFTFDKPISVAGTASQFTGDNGYIINFDTAASLKITSTGFEDLTLDLESISNTATIASTTGVTSLVLTSIALTVGGTAQSTITEGLAGNNGDGTDEDDDLKWQGLLDLEFDTSIGALTLGNSSPTAKGFYVDAPAAETIAAAATITADACGGFKAISSGGAVTTGTTNTFTAPAAGNEGCIMHVCNTGANNITLDNNALFKSAGGADVVMTPDDCVVVVSSGSVWYQGSALLAN